MKNILWINKSCSLFGHFEKLNGLKNINSNTRFKWYVLNRSIATTTTTNKRNPPSILKDYGSNQLKDVSVKNQPTATTTITKTTKELSNRQKFNQIQPPVKLYEKLERLGFGALRQTKKYQALNKQQRQRHKKKLLQNEPLIPDPIYNFPILSFFAGAKTPSSFPPENMEEIGFVGRSNVGKSSLLNSLASTTIVRTSDKPGLTQQINFFNVGRLFTMVDMPGYGFAFVDENERKQWRGLMEDYITKRKVLKRLYVVIDARHGLKLPDIEFLQMLDRNKVKFQIVMTKSDLPVLPVLAKRTMVVKENIEKYHNAVKDVIVVSSKSGAGINQMRKEMLFLVGHLKPREFYENKK